MARHVALITGAGSGIGRAVALAFDAHGAAVIAADLNAASAEATAQQFSGPKVSCPSIHLDVTSAESVASCSARLGSDGIVPDVLVHCAGITSEEDGPAHLLADDVWDATIATNLTGTYRVCKAVIPGMISKGGGSIVNVASLGALVGIGIHAYSASKGGVLALTRSLAVTYGPQGIRCNVIAPGPIETPMTASMLDDPVRRRERLATVPLGRPGKPEEVASLALYLGSDDSGFVTGAVISIDGGAAAL
jgi:NAD(P)-dependent dehydrogenase (short-subunit alcohol dehydrogenase family)